MAIVINTPMKLLSRLLSVTFSCQFLLEFSPSEKLTSIDPLMCESKPDHRVLLSKLVRTVLVPEGPRLPASCRFPSLLSGGKDAQGSGH